MTPTQKAKDNLKKGEIEAALKALSVYENHALITISAEFEKLKLGYLEGTFSDSEYSSNRNKIIKRLLELIKILENETPSKKTSDSQTQTPKKLTSVPSVNPKNLVGREKELEELHQRLSDNQQVVVVNGMGGIGKTTLAAAYAFQYSDYYKHIVWVTHSPENRDNFEFDMALNTNLAEALNIQIEGKKPGQIYVEMCRALRGDFPSPKLFIIDDAKVPIEDYLDDLPSQPDWHLLVTSRSEIETLIPLNLSFLKPDEAMELFKTHCPNFKEEKAILSILKSVDYHTLSIEILAKTAKQRGTDIQKLREAIQRDIKANVKTRHSGKKKTVEKITSYLNTIFDFGHMSETELLWMKHFACLPPEFHDFELIFDLFTGKDAEQREDLYECLNMLSQKGWLIKNEENDEFKMHQVIGEVVKGKEGIAFSEIKDLTDRITDKLRIDQTKDNPVHKFPWVPFGKSILDIIQNEKDAAVSLLQNELALVLKALGDYEGAKNLFEKSKDYVERNFGKDHPETAIRYSNLALVLEELGHFEEAKDLLEKTVKSAEKSYGNDHPQTTIYYSNLATVLCTLGDYEGAKNLLGKTVKSAEKSYGKDHPQTAFYYSNLALALKDLGKYEEAKKLFQKIVSIMENSYEEGHPHIAQSYSNLAITLQALGGYEGAKKLLKKAIKSAEKSYGKDHPQTAIYYSNLASVISDLGDYEGAKELLEKTVNSAEKSYGKDHPQTAIYYSNLATVLYALGDLETAEKYSEKSVIIFKKALPEGHPNIQTATSILEGIRRDMKKKRE